MIPRRLYEHVKSHYWFAVAIDFIIVVVGVFIGLQAQEWGALRGDRARLDQDRGGSPYAEDDPSTIGVALFILTTLEVNRIELVDAQQEAGISPVDETPASVLAETFARDAGLLAAARNYWLYTNRHLKLMKELRGAAAHLAETIEAA